MGFFSEVSSALRLTDGALILVDVLEGVSTQTYTVLKQAYEEKVQCILVLNKIDRLFNELGMEPLEIFKQLSIIIEQLNAILSSLIAQEINQDKEKEKKTSLELSQNKSKEDNNLNMAQGLSLDEEYLDKIEDKMYFSPEKGNVIFCSAMDNWGFTIHDFAAIFAKKLSCNEKVLQKFLWGDYYLHAKTKRVFANPQHDRHKPLFVEFILQNIANIYEKVRTADIAKIEIIAKSLSIELPAKYKDLANKDPQNLVMHLMNKWLPLDRNVLKVVIKLLPSPLEAQKTRLQAICKKALKLQGDGNALKEAIEGCKAGDNVPTTVFISKMMPVPNENINEHGLGLKLILNYLICNIIM